MSSEKAARKKIKCLVWDLDNTLWEGILLEDDPVVLKENADQVIMALDERGILQSIASKNDHELAMKQLETFGLQDYFLYPQINWSTKSASIDAIAKSLNIGRNTLAFIDDQSFEREEVTFAHPEVRCFDASDMVHLPNLPAFKPRFITDESKKRRQMYMAEKERNQVESGFEGPTEAFLSTLDMVLRIGPADEEDLKRAEELTVRTNQLNTTGYSYTYDELDHFRLSDRHRLYVATLDDKYGTYGKIGLSLVETEDTVWTIKLLLMSCRVMSRGVGTVFINHIRNEARDQNVALRAEFIPTGVNRMMYMTYKFTHFAEHSQQGDLVILENDLSQVQTFPEYLEVIV